MKSALIRLRIYAFVGGASGGRLCTSVDEANVPLQWYERRGCSAFPQVVPHPPAEKLFVDNLRSVRLSFASQIEGQFCFGVVVYQVRNRNELFRLTIPGFIDRYSQAISGLPCVFHIGILQDGSDDRFAANTASLGYVIPPLIT